MMVQVKKAKYVRDYKLALTFADGSRGVVDLEDSLYGLLEPLRDKRAFRHAYVEGGTVCWRGGELNLAPSYLHALAHGLARPSSQKAAQANEREVGLRELRELAGVTQTELAKQIGITQSELSRLERRKDAQLGSLRRYVEALGGKLKVSAQVGGKRVAL